MQAQYCAGACYGESISVDVILKFYWTENDHYYYYKDIVHEL